LAGAGAFAGAGVTGAVPFVSPFASVLLGTADGGPGGASLVCTGAGRGVAAGAGIVGRVGIGGGGGAEKNKRLAKYAPPINNTPINAKIKGRRIRLPLSTKSGSAPTSVSPSTGSGGTPSSSGVRLPKLNLAMSPPSLFGRNHKYA